MKHAGADALDRLEPMLVQLRTFPALKEKSRGVFYVSSKAFLHFHEDPSGLFADVRLDADDDFKRWPVSSDAERVRLLREIEECLRR